VQSWGLSATEQDEVWARWRQGESLRLIARRLGKRGPSVRAFVLQTGGCNGTHRGARRGASPWPNAKRSAAVSPPASRADTSRPGWAGPSTVSRELARNGGRGRYRAQAADAAAFRRARRPNLPSWCWSRGCGRWGRPSWPCGGRPSRSPGGCRWPTFRSGAAGVARDGLSVAVHPEPQGAAS